MQSDLNFSVVKQGIDQGKACYTLVTSVAYVEPTQGKTAPKLAYTTSASYLKSESNYLRMNSLLLLSEKSYSRASGNNFEVILMPKGNQIDPEKVKVTWRFDRGGVKTFFLEAVQIVYSKTGITLTGHKTIDGKQLAFSIALAEVDCLI